MSAASPRVLFPKWLLGAALFLVFLLAPLHAQQWVTLGPDGGDVRSLAYDPANPDRIYLGTSAGQLYVSGDGGQSWARLAQFGASNDFVVDHTGIAPLAGTLYVATWSVEDNDGGDLFRSSDRGTTWEMLRGMHGKSIRSF